VGVAPDDGPLSVIVPRLSCAARPDMFTAALRTDGPKPDAGLNVSQGALLWTAVQFQPGCPPGKTVTVCGLGLTPP